MMKSKKTVAKMLLVAFVFSLVLPASVFAADAKTAADLNGHWAQTTIQQWMDKGMIGGYEDGTFRPDQSITRAEFIKLVNKAIGADKAGVVNFTDVSADDWFYGELQLAMGAGYVGGFEDGTFRPNDTVTRAQAAAFIAKAKNLANDTAAAARFVDNGSIADWAKGAVGAAAKAGYIGGYQDGTFQADKALTRAEAVSMLDRVMQAADKAKDEQKPAVSGGGSSSSGGSSGGGGGGGGSTTDKDDINTTELSYDASAGALTVKADTTVNAAALKGVSSVKNLTVNNGVTDVTIDGITVTGTTTINGGGSNSVHFANCTLQGQVMLSKEAVHVSLEGGTTVAQAIVVNQPAILSVENATISQPVEAKNDLTLRAGTVPAVKVLAKATVAAEANSSAAVTNVSIETTAPVTVAAPTETVVVAQASEAVTLESNVQTVEVNAATTVSVAQNATVTDLQAKAATTVGGEGSVTSATVATTAPVAIGATTDTVNVSTAEAQVTVDAQVSNVNVSEKATITVETDAKVGTIASTATGENVVTVTGSGDVKEVIATTPGAVEVKDSVNGEKEAPTVEQAYRITTEVKNLQGTAVANAATTTLPNVAQKSASVSFTVAVKAGYELISVVEGENTLTVENSKYTFTMGEKDATVTITVAEQPQWQAVPAGVSVTAVAQNGTAYSTTLSGTTTAAIENGQGQLFDGVDNANNKFAQCVLNLGGLKADTTYTVVQVNKALNAAYPDEFKDNTKTKTYTGKDLAEGLAVLVWQGEVETDITLTIKEGESVVRTITITNKTTPAPVAVTGVTLDKSALTLAVGGQAALTATVEPAKATNKAVTWSSDNTAVATVTDKGAVTAVSAGTATITVTTADGGKTATCTVTVKGAPQATITPGAGLTITAKTISGTFTGTLDADMFGTADQNADLGQLVITFSNLEDDQKYTIKQTNHALPAAYPSETAFKDNVKIKTDYTNADLADGLYVLVLHGDKNAITIELSATGDETVLQTLTLSNATTATTEATVKDLAELTAALAKDNLTTITLADQAGIEATKETAVAIPEGKTVIIPAGASLSGAAYITNNGTLVVNDAAGLALGASVGGNIRLGSDITLTDKDAKGTGKTFCGILDGQNHQIDYRNLKTAANNGVFAQNAKDAAIKNVTLYPNKSDISPFICNASGASFTYENVDICSESDKYPCTVTSNDNNESAYLNFSSATATTFKDCSNYLSYTGDISKIYLSAFLGGYMNVKSEATLTFDGCHNYGDLQMSHPAVFVGNGYSMGSVTIDMKNSANHGQIIGTADAKLFAAISHSSLKQDYDTMYASANEGTIKTLAAAWLTMTQDEEKGTITFSAGEGAPKDISAYNVSYTAMAKAENVDAQSIRSILLNYTKKATTSEELKPYQMIGKKEAEAAGIKLDNVEWTDFFYGITYTIVEDPCCLVFDFSKCTDNDNGKSFTLNVAQPEVTVTAVDKDGNPLGMAKLTYTVTPTPITPKESPVVNEKEPAEQEVPQEPADNDSVQTEQPDESTDTPVEGTPAVTGDEETTISGEPAAEEGGTSEQPAE